MKKRSVAQSNSLNVSCRISTASSTRSQRFQILFAVRRHRSGQPGALGPQTLYKVFGSKQALLSALVDVTVAGDDESVALPDRQFVTDIRALADAQAKLDRYARHLVDIHARQAQVMLAAAAAAAAAAATADAEAEAAAIWRKNLDDRRTGMTMFAADLASTGQLRPEHTIDTAADVLWLAMDVRNSPN